MRPHLRTRSSRVAAALAVALVVVVAIVLAVGGDGEGDRRAAGAPAPATKAARAADTVDIRDFIFEPAAITVAPGTTITFTNRDSAPHTATSGRSPAPDGTFDTGVFDKGQSRRVTLVDSGTYAYYCELHPFMKATLTVE